MLGRIVSKLRSFLHRPAIKVDPAANLSRLGSKGYGEWVFLDSPALRGATIVSVGLGEDASFDVEFAGKYGAKVVLVDPTPRAIEHFHKIQARFGQPATTKYVPGGNQPVASYALDALGPGNFVLIEKALWINDQPVKFFRPVEETHVSHSITNFQNNFSQTTPFIEVPSITPRGLVDQFGPSSLILWKLDIEGAEIAVLGNMLDNGILPNQLLVEFDVLAVPSRAAKEKAEAVDRRLREKGYRCVFAGGRNYSYARSPT